MTADRDHAAVYAAELAAFDGTDLEDVVGFAPIAALVTSIVDGSWWPGPHVKVRRARADARSSSARCVEDIDGSVGEQPTGEVTLRFAEPQSTVATTAHELAHALAGVRHGHDATFRRAYLDVVTVITNLDSTDRRGDLHGVQLAEAFRSRGLPWADRDWKPPGEERAGPIAL